MALESNSVIKIANFEVGKGKPLLIIAGPCVIEDEEILLKIANVLAKLNESKDINIVFKSSFDKANRTSNDSFRGLGITKGLMALEKVKKETGLPLITDIHESYQAEIVAEVCDVIQIPAFLARQTDLLVAAAKTNKPIKVKKGQFMQPTDMLNVIKKINAAGNKDVMLCERGTFFGYGSLVNDFKGVVKMQSFNVPVIFDATHSVQEPSALGNASGGDRTMVEPLAKCATVLGVDGLFFETHPDPQNAKSDGPNMVPLDEFPKLIMKLLKIREIALETQK